MFGTTGASPASPSPGKSLSRKRGAFSRSRWPSLNYPSNRDRTFSSQKANWIEGVHHAETRINVASYAAPALLVMSLPAHNRVAISYLGDARTFSQCVPPA